VDFDTKVLRSLSLGTGGKMTLSSEEAVVGWCIGWHQGNSWWIISEMVVGRTDGGCGRLSGRFEEAEEIDERVFFNPPPGKVGHV